ncbi:MAG: uncharacterized protein PWP71_516 [Clostridia bacterium]|jgi:hypothetical protein|nr:uncharacterized protein [Clostridia bacterium]
MKIYVDADACPVKDIIIEVAREQQIPVIMVCSLSHYSDYKEDAEYIIVDNIPQAADITIMNKVKSGDIVVTQDYGLASLVLEKGAIALHHSGKRYTSENIDHLLFKRHLAVKIRRGGGKISGPKTFSKKDKESFRQALLKLVLQFRQE